MIWFPVPEGVTTLPETPNPTVNSTPNAVDTILAPEGFDPIDVDIEDLFANIVQTGVAPLYPEELDIPPQIEPFSEIIEVDAVVKCGYLVLEAEYSLTPTVTTVSLPISCISGSVYFIFSDPIVCNITGNFASVVYTRDPIFREGIFSLNGQFAAFKTNPRKLQADLGFYNINTPRRIAIHSGEGSLLDTLEENNAVAVGTGYSISYNVYKFGSGSISNTGSAIVQLTRRPTSSIIKYNQDFTVSFWYRPSSTTSTFIPVFSFSEEYLIAQYQPNFSSTTLAFGRLVAGTGSGQVAVGVIFEPLLIASTPLVADEFMHVGFEKYNGQMRLFINGTSTSSVQTVYLNFNQSEGFTLFGVPVYAEDGSVTRNTNYNTSTQYFDDIVIDNNSRYFGNNFIAPIAPLKELISTKFVYKKTLNAGVSSYFLTGQTADLKFWGTKLVGETAVFMLSGPSAAWRRPNTLMPAAMGSFTSAGQNTLEGPIFVTGSNVAGAYSNTGLTSRLATLPSNLDLDDIIVLIAETSGDAVIYPELTGWNLVNDAPLITSTNASGCQLYVWWRRVSTLVQPEVYLPVIEHLAYGAFIVRGAVATGNPIEVSSATTSGSSTTVTAPSITTLRPLSKVIIITGHPNDTSSTTVYNTPINANLKDVTEHFEFSTNQGNGGGFGVFSGTALKSGAVGSTSISKTITSVNAIFVLGFVSTAVVTGPAQYTLNCTFGAHNLQGQTVTLTSQRRLVGQETNITLVGQIVSFVSGKILIGQAGSFLSTGQAAQWSVLRALSGSTGAVTLAGQNVSFVVNIGSLGGDQFELTALLEDDLLTLDF